MLISEITRAPFRLHPGLDPTHYEITNSLKDFERWLVYTHEGFTASDPANSIKRGQMAKPGYIMISLVDDTIVPISRGDEHHSGMDVMYDQIAKECKRNGHPINPRNYVPIWGYGHNYIYYKSDIPKMLTALTKFLSYGGRDGPLKGSNDLRGMMMNSSDFVERGGDVVINPGTIAPAGQKIMNDFRQLEATLRAAGELPEMERAKRARAFVAAAEFAARLRPYLSELAIKDYHILTDPKIIGAYKKANDIEGLKKLIFGFHGLKNSIHQEMKAYLDRQELLLAET